MISFIVHNFSIKTYEFFIKLLNKKITFSAVDLFISVLLVEYDGLRVQAHNLVELINSKYTDLLENI